MATQTETPEVKYFQVAYRYTNPKGQMRQGRLVVPAHHPTQAKQMALAHLTTEYKFFNIGKIEELKNDSTQRTIP